MSSIAKIAAVRRKWAEAINSGSADGVIVCVTNDAIWLPPRGDAVQGVEALRTWLGNLFDQFHYQFSISHEQVRLVGDAWAVEDAHFRSELWPKSGESEPMIHDGQYIVLWRRLDPSDWRIGCYIDRTEDPTIS